MNPQSWIKVGITVALVLGASALSKRPGVLGALVASLPVTSLLVLGWLYRDTHDAGRVATMSMDILWFVAGSLPFFPVLALSLRSGAAPWIAFALAAVAAFIGVSAVQYALTHMRA